MSRCINCIHDIQNICKIGFLIFFSSHKQSFFSIIYSYIYYRCHILFILYIIHSISFTILYIYRRNTVMVKDSNMSDWIYIVKSVNITFILPTYSHYYTLLILLFSNNKEGNEKKNNSKMRCTNTHLNVDSLTFNATSAMIVTYYQNKMFYIVLFSSVFPVQILHMFTQTQNLKPKVS